MICLYGTAKQMIDKVNLSTGITPLSMATSVYNIRKISSVSQKLSVDIEQYIRSLNGGIVSADEVTVYPECEDFEDGASSNQLWDYTPISPLSSRQTSSSASSCSLQQSELFKSVISPYNDIHLNLSIEEELHNSVVLRDIIPPCYFARHSMKATGEEGVDSIVLCATASHLDSVKERDAFKDLLRRIRSPNSRTSATFLKSQALSYSALTTCPIALLFSYINTPCVVIGRNQNPWKEASIGMLSDKATDISAGGIRLARRNSGGGTVYHDEGNVCISILTHRSLYDPARSVEVLRQYLIMKHGIAPGSLTTTKRNDLFLEGRKITGSAMKVTSKGCYHHYTLLVASERSSLGTFLKPSHHWTSVETRSVDSVRSPVTTLVDADALDSKHMMERVGGQLSKGMRDSDERSKAFKLAEALQIDFCRFFSNDPIVQDIFLSKSMINIIDFCAKEQQCRKEEVLQIVKQAQRFTSVGSLSTADCTVLSLPSADSGTLSAVATRVYESFTNHRTCQWQFLSTPKFTTFIHVILSSVDNGEDIKIIVHPVKDGDLRAPRDMGNVLLEISTSVERGRIVSIHADIVLPSIAQGMPQEGQRAPTWIGPLMTTFLRDIPLRGYDGYSNSTEREDNTIFPQCVDFIAELGAYSSVEDGSIRHRFSNLFMSAVEAERNKCVSFSVVNKKSHPEPGAIIDIFPFLFPSEVSAEAQLVCCCELGVALTAEWQRLNSW